MDRLVIFIKFNAVETLKRFFQNSSNNIVSQDNARSLMITQFKTCSLKCFHVLVEHARPITPNVFGDFIVYTQEHADDLIWEEKVKYLARSISSFHLCSITLQFCKMYRQYSPIAAKKLMEIMYSMM